MNIFLFEDIESVRVEKKTLLKMQKDRREFEKVFGVDFPEEGRASILEGLIELNTEKLKYFKNQS